MCQRTDGELHRMLKPKVAYKVVTKNGYGPYFGGLFKPLRTCRNNLSAGSWFDGTVFKAQPKAEKRSMSESFKMFTYTTVGGFHVFLTLKEAEIYRGQCEDLLPASKELTIAKMIVWGDYFKFWKSGVAIEFATALSTESMWERKCAK